MRFMILVKADRDSEAGGMPDTALLTAMAKYNEALIKAGVLLAGEGLHPSAKGLRVRFADGKQTVTAGPFGQTGELLAGFWLIQVKSMDEAIVWVKRCPMDGGAELEVRQVFEADDFGAEMTPELKRQEQDQRARVALRH